MRRIKRRSFVAQSEKSSFASSSSSSSQSVVVVVVWGKKCRLVLDEFLFIIESLAAFGRESCEKPPHINVV